jgi:DUF4097 and DUF4098 domain-containing protein YvlB
MRSINHSARLTAATLLALLLGSYLYSSDANAEADYGDISKVNGRIQVEANEPVGNVSTVNGRIDIAHGATAGRVKTVNGGINLAGDTVVERLETVNGDIEVASNVKVSGSMSTVNGSVDIGQNVQVEGMVKTVNGGIRLDAESYVSQEVRTTNGDIRLYSSEIGRDLVTSNGDMTLSEGTVVNGDIIYKNKRRWWNNLFGFGFNRDPLLTIDESSTVRGDIHLYHKVDLDIAVGADVGEVIYHY